MTLGRSKNWIVVECAAQLIEACEQGLALRETRETQPGHVEVVMKVSREGIVETHRCRGRLPARNAGHDILEEGAFVTVVQQVEHHVFI